jgi:hypothetical protein
MKIHTLLSLVATTISTAGAPLNTERIDQLTGLRGKLDEKKVPKNQLSARRHRGFSRWLGNTGLHGTHYLGIVHPGHP